MRSAPRSDETGIALITTLLVLMMVSALMIGFFATITADQRASGIDRDQTQAYAAAHAGLEKMTSDLATLFAGDVSPSVAQINAVAATPPTIPNFAFTAPGGGTGYSLTFTPDVNGNPAPPVGAFTCNVSSAAAAHEGHIALTRPLFTKWSALFFSVFPPGLSIRRAPIPLTATP